MTLTLPALAEKMADIDFATLYTKTEGGRLAGRPMSNNGEVEWEGTSYYFTWDASRMVRDIEGDRNVALAFQGSAGLFGKPPLFVSVEGEARLVRDKAAFAEHWTKDLDRWFAQGVDTPGIVMIAVEATRIHYWDGEDQGEIVP